MLPNPLRQPSDDMLSLVAFLYSCRSIGPNKLHHSDNRNVLRLSRSSRVGCTESLWVTALVEAWEPAGAWDVDSYHIRVEQQDRAEEYSSLQTRDRA